MSEAHEIYTSGARSDFLPIPLQSDSHRTFLQWTLSPDFAHKSQSSLIDHLRVKKDMQQFLSKI